MNYVNHMRNFDMIYESNKSNTIVKSKSEIASPTTPHLISGEVLSMLY
jgi:hypothetical protein